MDNTATLEKDQDTIEKDQDVKNSEIDDLDIVDPYDEDEFDESGEPWEDDDGELESKKESEPAKADDQPRDEKGNELDDPVYDDSLLTKAATILGLHSEEAKRFTPDRLKALVEKTEARLTPSEEKSGPNEKLEDGNPESKRIPRLDPEIYDDELCQAFDAMATIIENIDKVQSKSSENTPNADAQAFASRFDARLSSLNEMGQSLLGTAPVGNISKESAEFKNRHAILGEMMELAVKHPSLSEDELFDRALGSTFPQVLKSQGKTEIREQLNRRSKQQSFRPSSRTPSNLTPEQKAARSIRAKMEEMKDDWDEDGDTFE